MSQTPIMPIMRIGEGWDIHPLVSGRALILGGVVIEYDKGLAGHSDADALLHATTDALLGAAGLGDIGRHFPDTNPAYAGANSALLLARAWQLVSQGGWLLCNIDATIIAQAPRLAPYVDAMAQNIARTLGASAQQVNVKAKTAEHMDAVGRGDAMQARAVALLMRA